MIKQIYEALLRLADYEYYFFKYCWAGLKILRGHIWPLGCRARRQIQML